MSSFTGEDIELGQDHTLTKNDKSFDNIGYVTSITNIDDANKKDTDRKDEQDTLVTSSCESVNRVKSHLKTILLILVLIAYYVYFFGFFKLVIKDENDIRLIWMTAFATAVIVYKITKKFFGEYFKKCHCNSLSAFIRKYKNVLRWVPGLMLMVPSLSFCVIVTAIKSPKSLISIVGYGVFILGIFISSTNKKKIKLQPVIGGLGLQMALGIFIIKTDVGFSVFDWLGDRVSEFMSNANVGAEFVFGELYYYHPIAFKVLPTVIFLGAVVAVLYHLGIMKVLISSIAGFFHFVMGTSMAESVNAAGNIFIGMTEAPLLIAPFLKHMTKSEINAVMIGGFGTVAGSVMAAYIVLGVPAKEIVSASVMAAPLALAMAKLSCPEEKEDIENEEENNECLESSIYQNSIEAACGGASSAISLVANIAANLIAFVAMLTLFNTILAWFGERAGFIPPEYPTLTFQFICSYIFWPVSYLMGVPYADCRKVAELIGTKIVINDFVAFTLLGKLINNTQVFNNYNGNNGSWEMINNDIYLSDLNETLYGGAFTEDKSYIVSTFALCGFANFGSMGILMGGLTAIEPSIRPVVATLIIRAMLIGTIVSLMNGCIAGLLF